MLEGGRITSFLLLLAQTSGYAPSIVITGGPCSGKTSAIESLPSSIAGFEIIKVPEAATLYFERGGRFPFGTPADSSGRFSPLDRNLLWESWLVELKISLENHAHFAAAAKAKQADVTNGYGAALICDRGIFDSRAYMASDDDWRKLLHMGGWSEAELLSRYANGGVACLDVAPRQLYNLGNEARHESYTEALFRGDETWDAWSNVVLRVDSRRKRLSSELVVTNRNHFGDSGSSSSDDIAGTKEQHLSSTSLCSPVRIPNMGSDFQAKTDSLRTFIENRLEGLAVTAKRQRSGASSLDGKQREAPSSSASNFPSLLAMPIEFLVEQADTIATETDLGKVYQQSVTLLRDVQIARRGDSARRRFLLSEQKHLRPKKKSRCRISQNRGHS